MSKSLQAMYTHNSRPKGSGEILLVAWRNAFVSVLAILSNHLPLPGSVWSGYPVMLLHSTKRAPVGLIKGC